MKIKKGIVENTMDNVMLIMFLVCIALIIIVSSTSYLLYRGSVDNIGNPDSSFEQLVSEDGYILINGEKFITDKKANEYTFANYCALGWNLFNRQIFSVGNAHESFFSVNTVIIILCVILFVYWIWLLIIFEKERKKKIISTNITDEEIMSKYNPLIAGCIEGNRSPLHSDIAAVILGLINKKIIDLKLENVSEGKNFYKYILVRNKTNEVNAEMDEIESYVHTWIFGTGISACDEIEMLAGIRRISEDNEYSEKFKKLKKMAKKELNKIGANKNKVPVFLRAINVGIFILAILIGVYAIWSGVLYISVGTMDIVLIYFAIMLFGFSIPLLIFITYAGILAFMQTKRVCKLLMEKIARREIIRMSVLVIITLITMIIATEAFEINFGIIPYEIFFSLALLIMKTDNLMLQNDDEILVDYNRLKMLKEKIKGYTLLDKRKIEDIKLWEEYSTYAVAFGISKDIIKDTGRSAEKIIIDKPYLYDLILDTITGFWEVNF